MIFYQWSIWNTNTLTKSHWNSNKILIATHSKDMKGKMSLFPHFFYVFRFFSHFIWNRKCLKCKSIFIFCEWCGRENLIKLNVKTCTFIDKNRVVFYEIFFVCITHVNFTRREKWKSGTVSEFIRHFIWISCSSKYNFHSYSHFNERM